MSRAASRSGSSGQTFLIVVLLTAALVPLLLLCFNIFLSARAKSRLVNAGDAAALAAAKWQGATLNLIGELNLSHLAAACDPALDGPSRTNVIDGINALAARIAFAGPVTGLWAANAAARKNFPDGALRESPGMRSLVQEEASFVRNQSSLFADELWPSRGEDYATMLDAVLSAGITVGADNSAQVSSFASVLGNHFYFQKN